MPRPGEQKVGLRFSTKDPSKTTMPKLTPMRMITTPKYIKINDNNQPSTEPKGIVGAVTTWFPPSSTIQVGDAQEGAPALLPQRPQFVEFVGNRKYLVVPTHNVVAVSPTVAPVTNPKQSEIEIIANRDSLEAPDVPPGVLDSASLGSECHIKLESEDVEMNDDGDNLDRLDSRESVKLQDKSKTQYVDRGQESMEVDFGEPPALLPAPVPMFIPSCQTQSNLKHTAQMESMDATTTDLE